MHNNLTPVKIAGGGIAGLAAAMYLRKKNFKVVVYEKVKLVIIGMVTLKVLRTGSLAIAFKISLMLLVSLKIKFHSLLLKSF